MIKIETRIVDNFIYQDIKHADLITKNVSMIQSQVIDTAEEQIRNALIKLGWTPPEGK